jgi:hypothetical protein
MISHTDSTYISKLKNEYHEDVDQYCVLAGLKGLVDKEDVENPLYIRDIDHNDVTGVMHSPSDQWDKKNRQIVSLLVILYASRLE